jgi:hypothetical protein
MTASKEEVREKLSTLNSIGSKALGGMLATAVGIATGIPFVGVLLAPYTAGSLENLGKSLIDQGLGPRKEKRIEALIQSAAYLFNMRSVQGEMPRDDGFYSSRNNQQPAAQEILEAVLIAATESFEEAKLVILANTLANICYNKNITRATAQVVLRTLNELTYREILIVGLVGTSRLKNLSTYVHEEKADYQYGYPTVSIELLNLYKMGIIKQQEKTDDNNSLAVLGPEGFRPSRLILDKAGETIFEIAGLIKIDFEEEEVSTLVSLLGWSEQSNAASEARVVVSGGTY